MDTKLKLKRKVITNPRVRERQLAERQRLIQQKRDSRPVPMMINSPRIGQSMFSRKRPASPPPTRIKKTTVQGVKKVRQGTIKNERGRAYAVRRQPSGTRASSCSSVLTLPQEGAICWFAAVFTTLFFSQYMRVVVKNHARNLVRDPKSRDIATAMLEIIRGYETNKVSARVVNHMRPRQFLMDLRTARPDYFTAMTNQTDEAHYGPYQHAMLAFLRTPHLSIGVVNGSFKYSGFNVDLPLDHRLWPNAMKTMSPKGVFVDTRYPEVIMFHKDSGEDYLQTLWGAQTPPLGTVSGYSPSAHIPVIKYNGKSYILDSCIIGAELRTPACSVAHAIAGVTCNNQRYLYNGWTAKSADPAMKGAAGSNSAIRDMPCALGRYDWDQNRSFCINTAACRFQNARPNQLGRELCFNAVARSSVTYIRADIARSAGYKKIGRLLKK